MTVIATAATSRLPAGSSRSHVTSFWGPARPFCGSPSTLRAAASATASTATAFDAAPTRLRKRSPPDTQRNPATVAAICQAANATSPATNTTSSSTPSVPTEATAATAPCWSTSAGRRPERQPQTQAGDEQVDRAVRDQARAPEELDEAARGVAAAVQGAVDRLLGRVLDGLSGRVLGGHVHRVTRLARRRNVQKSGLLPVGTPSLPGMRWRCTRRARRIPGRSSSSMLPTTKNQVPA